MCGIAGYFSQTAQPVPVINDRVQSMIDRMKYRGPDGQGCFVSPQGRVGLGHRRLAILDLKPTGHQPMHDATGRYTLIFNGEIYNFRALRESLIARGVVFRSTGDGEVLLYLLIHEGIQALHQLRGMFALAFWDEQEQSLLLARDRFGIKPLVYHEHNDSVVFGSELAALASADAKPKIDPAGFYYYLLWGSIAAPHTWLQGYTSLQPGCWRAYHKDKSTTSGSFADAKAWYADTPSTTPVDITQFRQQVGAAVEESVKLHLESDVPVGVFLSGGIDSSSLVSAVRQVTGSKVQTYTITFAESTFSEETIAQEVAKQFETEHHVCKVTSSQFLNDWPTIFAHYDQPTLDAFNSYYVSKVVAESGLKVVLSGTGGDEYFGGYPSFRWLPAMQSRKQILRWVGPLLELFQKPHRRAKWKHLCKHVADATECYRSIRGLFMPHEIQAILGPAVLDRQARIQEQVHELESMQFRAIASETVHASVSRLESRQYLCTQLLRDIDVMSMAHALEVRVPLVDHVLCQTLWPKLGHTPELMQNKRLLYETLKQPLPTSVYDRPKQGFTFPMEAWVKQELRSMVMEGMQHLATHGWIEKRVPEILDTGIQAGTVHWSRPWALAVCGQLAMMRVAS
ncbi:MAG: asparagine synthase (glutamine-hydrolyzing) [Planctomycetia bacterium]|nr:asparagine synthase (glutamine-hydrolyzing) [Planctomycetia bacterium]